LKLSPSVLSADFVILGQQLDIMVSQGILDVHYDMMDGDFVPQVSFGPAILKTIRRHYPQLRLDVHMMVTEPGRYVEEMKNAGADLITVHYEACRHIDRVINQIKSLGISAGVSINPGTPVSVLEDILPELDMVLIMGVNPGFGGQKLIPYTFDKIRKLKRMREEKDLSFSIQEDGGATVANARSLADSGVDNLVAGSAVFNGDIKKNIEDFKVALGLQW